MPRCLVKLAGHYLEWSTVVDSFVSPPMDLDELRSHVFTEQGNEGLARLPARLERLDATGTSMNGDNSVTETVWLNRAGPNESPINLTEMVEFYVTSPRHFTARELGAFRRAKKAKRCKPCPAKPDAFGDGYFCECFGSGWTYPEAGK